MLQTYTQTVILLLYYLELLNKKGYFEINMIMKELVKKFVYFVYDKQQVYSKVDGRWGAWDNATLWKKRERKEE